MVNSNYKTAIVLHVYYQDLWPEFKEKILPVLSDDTHLYVSINERNEYTEDIEKYSKEVFLVDPAYENISKE
jgi:lipopolysaccharide biosynthesis protein